jgi:phage terminase small subunit
MALTDKQRRFVDEYLVDLNATQAAIRAGYAQRRADAIGYENLRKPEIEKYLATAMKVRAERTQITQDMVLKRWWDLANVDANELVEYRRDNCRHCWGIDHGYQWTDGEYAKAQNEADENGKPPPEFGGGFGFVFGREPNADCPECGGEGRGKVHVHDTRKLKGAARQLYAGVHQGKDGLKVLLEERSKALDNVAKHLGMFKERIEHSGEIKTPELKLVLNGIKPA